MHVRDCVVKSQLAKGHWNLKSYHLNVSWRMSLLISFLPLALWKQKTIPISEAIPKPHGHPQSSGLDAKRSHSPPNLLSGLFLRCWMRRWEMWAILKCAKKRRRKSMDTLIRTAAMWNEYKWHWQKMSIDQCSLGSQRVLMAFFHFFYRQGL